MCLLLWSYLSQSGGKGGREGEREGERERGERERVRVSVRETKRDNNIMPKIYLVFVVCQLTCAVVHLMISTGHSGDCVSVVRSESGEDGGSQVRNSTLQSTQGCLHSAD